MDAGAVPRAEGDAAAFSLSGRIEALVDQWAGLIRQAAQRFNIDDAEFDELVQDLRIRLWRTLERQGEKGDGVGASYMRKVALSVAVDRIRRRRSRGPRRMVPLDQAGELAAPSGPPADGEQVARMVELLERLPLDRRVAVRLHLDGKDRKEIAELTGWSEARTRNLLYRGLAELREAVGRVSPEGGAR